LTRGENTLPEESVRSQLPSSTISFYVITSLQKKPTELLHFKLS